MRIYFQFVLVPLALCCHYLYALSLLSGGIAPGELIHCIRSGLEHVVQQDSTKVDSNQPEQDSYVETAQYAVEIYQASMFKMLRRHCGISEALYRDNLNIDKLQSLLADSKSGQLFLRSSDDLIIIKTIKQYECSALMELLPSLADHVSSGPSLLGNLLGVYKVRTQTGSKYVLVTKNIYHSSDNSATIACSLYDLKGSTVGRRKSAESVVHKDLDLLDHIQQHSIGINIGPVNKQALLEVLKRDVQFLSKHNLMDY
ncbi:hypothetical protein EON64_19130, partial [archaeon]